MKGADFCYTSSGPLLVVEQGQPRRALGAQGAFDPGHVRVALDPLDVVIFHQDPDGTAHPWTY